VQQMRATTLALVGLLVLVACTVLPSTEARSSFSPPHKNHRFRALQRYAILQTGELPEDLLTQFGSYSRFFVDWLHDKSANEKWDVFVAYEGKLPPKADIAKYDGFIVTGSKFDAHGTDEWIQNLKLFIYEIYSAKKRLLSICFGHQVTALALGGVSGPSDVGWELGYKKIHFNGNGILAAVPGFPSEAMEMEAHHDQVSAIPPAGLVLASSDKCPYEMYQVPATNPTVLATQFHPELDVVYNRASVPWKKRNNFVPAAIADAAMETITQEEEGGDPVAPQAVKDLLKKFIKGEL